jgi:hypothetical protein
MSIARHDPDTYFESQGGWPEYWPDALYYDRWLTMIDQSAPDPAPQDLEEPDPWFPAEPAKDPRPIRPRPNPRSAA